jgi:hypothetical protein
LAKQSDATGEPRNVNSTLDAQGFAVPGQVQVSAWHAAGCIRLQPRAQVEQPIEDYEQRFGAFLAPRELNADNYRSAVNLAELPEQISWLWPHHERSSAKVREQSNQPVKARYVG